MSATLVSLDSPPLAPHIAGMKSDEWLSTQRIADELGVTSEWVRRQILAGRLQARRFDTGDRSFYRIRRADLETFLDRYTQALGGRERR
jgi:excisionase family DNA binding protein